MERSWYSAVWLAAGLALSSATQLRFGRPVGVGEILLVSWVGAVGLSMLMHRRLERSGLLTALAVFWGVSLVAVLGGSMQTPPYLTEQQTAGFVQYDLRALLLAWAVAFAFVAAPGFGVRVRRAVLAIFAVGVVPVFMLWLAAQFRSTLGPLELWFGPRFLGWSQNPNQVALTMLAMPFLGAHLATQSSGWVRRWSVLAGLATITVGVATRSDALLISWAIGAVAFALLWWLRLATRGFRRLSSFLLVYGAAPIVALAAALVMWPNVVERVVRSTEATASEGRQGSTRMVLWKRGLNVLGEDPVFGSGLGPRAGSPEQPVAEAHNTVIDWGASTGLVGLVAYVGLLGWTAHTVRRARQPALAAGVIAMFCFSMFHFVLRQPIYWFSLLALVGHALTGTSVRRPVGIRPLKAVSRRNADIAHVPSA